jgi:hypothetical protein
MLISLSAARQVLGLPESADRTAIEAAYAREAAAVKARRPTGTRPASHAAAQAVVERNARSWSAEVAAINAAAAAGSPASPSETHEGFMRRINPAVAASSASWLTASAGRAAPPVTEPRVQSLAGRGFESVARVITGETHDEFMHRCFGVVAGVRVGPPRPGDPHRADLMSSRPGAGSAAMTHA